MSQAALFCNVDPDLAGNGTISSSLVKNSVNASDNNFKLQS